MLDILLNNLVLLSAALSCAVSVVLSVLLSRSLAGRKLRIGKIQLHLKPSLSIQIDNVHYSHQSPISTRQPELNLPDQPFSLTATEILLKFHIPRPTSPVWATITISDIFHSSTQAAASSAQALLTFWFFPYAFRFTAGTFVNVQIDDFRVRVFNSRSTPCWVEILRRNLIMTILKGELLRCDDFKTSARFGVPDRYSSHEAMERELMDGAGEEEMMITVIAGGYHIKNRQGRIYALDGMNMQWRKSMETEKGRFVMIVTGGRWIKVRELYELITPIHSWYQILSSLAHIPFTLYQTYLNPASAADVHISTTNISYDQFRLRDSEMLRQIGLLTEEHAWAIGGIVEGVLCDLLMRGVRPGSGLAGAVTEHVSERRDKKGLACCQKEQRGLEEVAQENKVSMASEGLNKQDLRN